MLIYVLNINLHHNTIYRFNEIFPQNSKAKAMLSEKIMLAVSPYLIASYAPKTSKKNSTVLVKTRQTNKQRDKKQNPRHVGQGSRAVG